MTDAPDSALRADNAHKNTLDSVAPFGLAILAAVVNKVPIDIIIRYISYI